MVTEGRWAELRGWMSDIGALAVTAIGLALYVALRLPTAIFYMRLGTSPEEIGIGYADVLSRSTLGTLACLLMGSAIVFVGSSYVTLFVASRRMFSIAAKLRRHGGNIEKIDDARFEAGVSQLKRTFDEHPEFARHLVGPVEEHFRKLRRRRELAQLASRTAAEEEELTSLRVPTVRSTSSMFRGMASLGSTSKRQIRGLLIGSVLVVLAALIGLATVEAERVRDGDAPLLHDVPLFSFDARPVRVVMTEASGTDQLPADLSVRKNLFLLGAGDAYLILFDPETDETLRVPIGAFYLVGD